MSNVSNYIIPMMLLYILVYGKIHNVKVYDCFVEGAREGMKTAMRIFPYLLAIIMAVTILRSVNLLEYIIKFLSPVTRLLGIPGEVLPLVLIKPLSGSGALGIYAELLQKYGADSFIGRLASVIMGSTETIFYTITIYFGAVGIKKIRHTLWAAIIAEIVAVIVAVNVVKILF